MGPKLRMKLIEDEEESEPEVMTACHKPAAKKSL